MSDSGSGITAIVLCGGGGRRFGGRDKPLELLGGRPLVAHVLDRLDGQAESILISANRNLSEYGRFGYPVVADQIADRGPLAGIQAALAEAETDWLFICPGDAPFLPEDLIVQLSDGFKAGAEIAIAHDGERVQHLFMLLQRSQAEGIGDYLEGGGRSVSGWLTEQSVVAVPIDDRLAFTNVNTEEELAQAELLV